MSTTNIRTDFASHHEQESEDQMLYEARSENQRAFGEYACDIVEC